MTPAAAARRLTGWLAERPVTALVTVALAAGYAVSGGHIYELSTSHGQAVWTAVLISACPELQVVIGWARMQEALRPVRPVPLGKVQASILGVYATSGLLFSAAANLATVRPGKWPEPVARWEGWDAAVAVYPVWTALGALLLLKLPTATATAVASRRRAPAPAAPAPGEGAAGGAAAAVPSPAAAPAPAPASGVAPPATAPRATPDGEARRAALADLLKAAGAAGATTSALAAGVGVSRTTAVKHLARVPGAVQQSKGGPWVLTGVNGHQEGHSDG